LVHELSKHGSSFVHNGQIPLGSGGGTVQKSRTKMKSKKVMTPVSALFCSSKTVVAKILTGH
jgi:hypothetical protein